MGLKLTKNLLSSRVVREAVNGGEPFKQIDLSGAITVLRDQDGGLLSGLLSLARGTAGLLWSVLNFGGFTVTAFV